MTVTLSFFRLSLRLTEPYHLSFATLDAFESFLVTAKGDGRFGLGEITPLPGYSEETPESVEAAWRAFAGESSGARARAEGLAAHAPMFASGVVCALETWEAGASSMLHRQPRAPVPLTALCPGNDPAAAVAAARRLVSEGYRSVKLKVGGGDIGTDVERVAAVAEAVPRAEIRVDANQALDPAGARRIARALERHPDALFEQPFVPAAWNEFAALADATTTRLMLDESIWTAADIDRAQAVGARLVKLKLCKHPGLAATRDLLAHARGQGLDVVFGNGVQSVVGNHYEALLHEDAGLTRASEANGFLKVADALLPHALSAERGALVDGGLDDVAGALAARTPLAEAVFIS